jgi:putative ABC transport system permease protein
MFADVRYALRQLKSSPGFAVAAIFTLALGIGATTTIFSVADALLFRPLPYPHSDRLVMVWDELSKIGVHRMPVSLETFDAYRTDVHCFDATAAFTEEERTLIVSGTAERVSVLSSSPGLFEMLGARVAVGRGFRSGDWNPQHNDVAVLSNSLFARRFGANPGIIGRPIRLEGRLYTVAGVLTPDFEFSLHGEGNDVWVPLPTMKDPRVWQFRMLARMRPGIPIETAQASIRAAARHVEETVRPYRGPNDEDPGYRANVISFRDQLFGDFRTSTLLLLTAVALLLLVACVNVVNLLLARAVSREKEIAIRRALGASGHRLLRQWITEAAVLATIGGSAGLLLTHWGILLLKVVNPAEFPHGTRIGTDFRVLLFAIIISTLVCLLLSLAHAIPLRSKNLSLRGPRRTHRLANILVAAEVALALMLLITCSLLIESFAKLRQIDPGVRVDHLLTMQIQLSGQRYGEARQRAGFFSGLQDRLARLPGMVSVSTVDRLPVFTVGVDTTSGNPFSIDGHLWNPDAPSKQIAHNMTVGLDYFRTMGIPFRRGRDFSPADGPDAPPVAIVNETLARKFFPDGNAVGRHILFGAPDPKNPDAHWMTIVGIIGDVRTGALDLPPMPQFYRPEMQDGNGRMFVVLRTMREPTSMARVVLCIVHQLDPQQPVFHVSTMENHVAQTLGQPRFRTTLLSFFASVALFLAALGVYGVVAHAAVQRTKEIGIRIALGADAARVITAILRESLRPIAAGIVLGIAGTAMLTRFLSSVLYHVKPDDPGAVAWSVALMAIVGAAACGLPAIRASRVDPVIALRQE